MFRKILDGFDPESDAFLLTDYTFKGLYKLRENLAVDYELSPDVVCDVPMLYLFSKIRPVTIEDARKKIDE